MSLTTNDLKMNIIHIISNLNDIETLNGIYQSLTDSVTDNRKDTFLKGVAIELRNHVSFDDILKEQNYKPISYQAFRQAADAIEWEHSLDELLEALD